MKLRILKKQITIHRILYYAESIELLDIEDMSEECKYCGALSFKNEPWVC